MHPMILEELRRKSGGGGGGGGGVTATFDPATNCGGITLSNGNLTATGGERSWDNGIKATTPISTGTKSFEIHFQSYGDTALTLLYGFCLSTVVYCGSYPALLSDTYWYRTTGDVYYDGVAVPSLPMWAMGSYIGFVVNLDTGYFEVYLNGVLIYSNTYAKIAGYTAGVIPCITGYSRILVSNLNCGETPFAYPLLPEDGWY